METTDAGITTNVQARFYSDELVRGRNVSVYAENGVVTLRGTVESEAAKQRAVALAREVQGVTNVRDELRVEAAATARTAEPAPSPSVAREETAPTSGRAAETVQPAWITTKIQAQYFVNPEVKPWNIDVTTSSDGVVTLEGTVEAAADKTEAVRIARETEGVTRVEDRLRVKGETAAGDDAPGLQRPDAWLTAKIQSKYFLDDLVKGRNIDVTTNNGAVTLNGTVASEAERRQAIALARSTEGVREVTDRLNLDATAGEEPQAAAGETGKGKMPDVPDLKRPDGWITMKVQSQYFLNPGLKSTDINVDTKDGVVMLKGTVASEELKKEAELIARETEGVSKVVNQLTVGVK